MAKLYSVVTNTAPTLTINLVRSNAPIDLTGASVDLYINLNGTVINSGHTSCSVTSPATSGVVTYALNTTDTATAGVANCEVKITYGDSTTEIVYQKFQLSIRDNLE